MFDFKYSRAPKNAHRIPEYSYVTAALRLRSHRNIRYTLYGIRYTLFGIRYTLYGHGGSHRSSTCFQCALFVSMKKVANSVF